MRSGSRDILPAKRRLRRGLADRPLVEGPRLLDAPREHEPVIRGASGQPKRQETESTIRFDAALLRPRSSEATGCYTVLALPESATARLPSPSCGMIEGTINGFPFRAGLQPHADGAPSLRVNRALQAAAGAFVGDLVSLEITRVGEEPECRVPGDLRDALATAPSAGALWSEVTPLARRDWILWIC
jgi:hypothetical protein